MFIKSKVNKVEESYRSPFTQEFFPTPVGNYFMSLNVTKIEKNLNSLLSEYANMMYLDGLITSVFFADFTSSHLLHFMIRKEISNAGYVDSGYYQVRILLDLKNQGYSMQGFSEYYFVVNDIDGSKRTISGDMGKIEEDKKTKPDRVLDTKHFAYGEVGRIFSNFENSFFANFKDFVYKNRLQANDECMQSFERREQLERSLLSINSMVGVIKKTEKSVKDGKEFLRSVGGLFASSMHKK